MKNKKIDMQNIKMNKFLTDNISLGKTFIVSVLDNFPGNIVFFNKKNEVVMCNSNALKLFSCVDSDELIEKFYSYIPHHNGTEEDPAQKFKSTLSDTLEEGNGTLELLFNNSVAHMFTAIVSFVCMNFDNDDAEKYIMATFQDISPYVEQHVKDVEQHEKDNEEISHLKKIMDATPFCLNLWNKDLENIMCNKKAVVLFELDNEQQYLDNFLNLSPEFQPNGRLSSELAVEHINNAYKNGHNQFNWLHCKLDGEEIPCEISLTRVDFSANESLVAGFTRDLRSEFIGAGNDRLYENYFYDRISDKALLSRLAELTDEWFFSLDTRTSVIQYYGKVVNEYGHNNTVSVKLGAALDNGTIHKEDIELYRNLIEHMGKGIYKPYDIRYLQKDGNYRYYRLIYQAINDSDGNPVFVVGRGLDIHEQKLLEERSKVDLLTGCYNKISAEQMIARKLLEGKDKEHALFIVDVDNFKAVNDNLGHFFGDEVLREVACNLKSSFRSHDIIARIGGDEFIVFIENVTNKELLTQKAKRIVEAFDKTYSGEYADYSISGSVGVAIYPRAGYTFEELYKSSDKALYHAKLLGKNRFVFYDDSMADGTMRDLTKLENADRIASTYFDYELITSVFNRLYEKGGVTSSVNLALQYIGQKYNADRCYIFETFDNGATYDNTYEWCDDGISSEIANLQGTPRYLYDDFFNSSHNGILYSNDLRGLLKSNEAYKLMADQGIKSFIHSQVKKDDDVTFFLGLDDCTKARIWSEKEINSLQYSAKIISIMLQGEQLRRQIEQLNEYNKLSAFISDSTDDIVYISDVENYELEYLNLAARVGFGLENEEDWKGKKCYDVLQNKNAPCEFCTNSILNENDFYEWTYYNPVVCKTYLLKDKLVTRGNKVMRLEIATDISAVKSLESELKEKLEEERLYTRCIDTLHSGVDPKASIDKILEIIAEFHDAERSYIFELSDDKKLVHNTYEWCALGISPQQQILQNIPSTDLSTWFAKYEEVGEFYISSVIDDLGTESPEYELLSVQGISSLVTAPIRDSEGLLTGFIGVDNPKEKIKKTELLRSVARFIATFLDETEMLTELSRLSYFDTLTGVKNRHSYRKTLNNIDNMQLDSLGVAYVDIKSLSSINDLHGSDYGDLVIKNVGAVLTEAFADDVYRVGGDEFVIVKPNMSEQLFENSISTVKDTFNAEEKYNVTVGYTFNNQFKDDNEDVDVVGGQKYSAILSRNLDNEIQSGKFVVYLQPQIDMKTGQFNGAEALIRRKNADGSVQPPIAFLPFYEKEGIVSKIDIFVFETVCKLLKSWQDSGYKKEMKISVNCSRVTVSEKNIVNKFVALCEKYLIDKSLIIIEITETISSACDELLSEILQNFKNAGFSISLDDFGCGYSNLSTLKLSNFNEIKIDMGLTKSLHLNNKTKTLAKVALDLCCELDGLVSVAEGIEYEEQYKILKEMNCDKGQGYYIDRPIDTATFTEKYIKDSN